MEEGRVVLGGSMAGVRALVRCKKEGGSEEYTVLFIGGGRWV